MRDHYLENVAKAWLSMWMRPGIMYNVAQFLNMLWHNASVVALLSKMKVPHYILKWFLSSLLHT